MARGGGSVKKREDSFVGVFIYNLITGVRHMTTVLLKSMLCRCGCRGWCTYYPVFLMMAWSFKALATGGRAFSISWGICSCVSEVVVEMVGSVWGMVLRWFTC